MSNGWNHAEGLAEQHGGSGSGLFVRLTGNGDKIVGAFVDDPFAREVHWGGERYEACTGDGCVHCEDGKKPSLRVALKRIGKIKQVAEVSMRPPSDAMRNPRQ
jgi:hypothetical protein